MEALGKTSDIMGKVNADMNISDIQNMMKTFQKESMKAEMNAEMVNEAMDMNADEDAADEVYD